MEKTSGTAGNRELHFEDSCKSIATGDPAAENQFFHWFKIKCYDGIIVEDGKSVDDGYIRYKYKGFNVDPDVYIVAVYSKEKINPFEIKSSSYNFVRNYITRAFGKYSDKGKISIKLCGEESPAYVSLTPLQQANFIVCKNDFKCTIEKAPVKFAELANPHNIEVNGKKHLVEFSLKL